MNKRNPNLACPAVKRPLKEYISPVTEKMIHTHSERKADMRASGSVDPRDLPNGGRKIPKH